MTIIINLYLFLALMLEYVLADQYKIIKQISKGKSSKVYEGINLTNGKCFAVKIQQQQKSSSILKQATILRNIQQQHQYVINYGLPFCSKAGTQDKYNYCLIDLLGNNLEVLLKKSKGIFKIKTFLMLADQMLKRMEFLHRHQYIHRSISLKKFLIGIGQNSKRLYLCGLGKGNKYRKQGKHILYSEGKKLPKQISYCSINFHLGIEQTRRDDLQSLMYCWVKMLYGKLPWENEQDSQKILSKKIQNSGDVIFSSFPKQIQQIYDYCRKLSFEEDPDYDFLRNLLAEAFQIYELEYDYDYQWEMKHFQQQQIPKDQPSQ